MAEIITTQLPNKLIFFKKTKNKATTVSIKYSPTRLTLQSLHRVDQDKVEVAKAAVPEWSPPSLPIHTPAIVAAYLTHNSSLQVPSGIYSACYAPDHLQCF